MSQEHDMRQIMYEKKIKLICILPMDLLSSAHQSEPGGGSLRCQSPLCILDVAANSPQK